MTDSVRPLEVPVLEGDARTRGKLCAGMAPQQRPELLKRLESAVKLRDEHSEQEWLTENWLRLEMVFPDVADFIRGQAEGFQVGMDDFIASVHADLLKDRARARRAAVVGESAWEDVEECSTFAFPLTGGGALVAKTRDNKTGAAARHTIYLHRDPAWACDWVLAVSSAGGPMAASSGMNGSGLTLVCNAVHPRVVGAGFHKGLVADAILSRCATVGEALALIRSVRHAGEGNFILGDRNGGVAAVWLFGEEPHIVTGNGGEALARTNHFALDEHSHLNVMKGDVPERSTNSRGRLAFLETSLAALPFPWEDGWEAARDWAAGILAHQDDGASTISFDNELKFTSSGAIYRTSPPELLISNGPPSRGDWRYWSPASS